MIQTFYFKKQAEKILDLELDTNFGNESAK